MFTSSNSKRLLVTVASPIELTAVLKGINLTNPSPTRPSLWQTIETETMSILHTGVGKANAAAAVARQLSLQTGDQHQYGAVLSIGLAGSFIESIELGSSVLALNHWMLDEGAILPEEPYWKSLQECGWATTSFQSKKGSLYDRLKTMVDHEADVGTVSTISLTDEQRHAYMRRSPIKIETMESAAIACVCNQLSVEYEDIRIISNFCGERKDNNHDFPKALRRLEEFVGKLMGCGLLI